MSGRENTLLKMRYVSVSFCPREFARACARECVCLSACFNFCYGDRVLHIAQAGSELVIHLPQPSGYLGLQVTALMPESN